MFEGLIPVQLRGSFLVRLKPTEPLFWRSSIKDLITRGSPFISLAPVTTCPKGGFPASLFQLIYHVIDIRANGTERGLAEILTSIYPVKSLPRINLMRAGVWQNVSLVSKILLGLNICSLYFVSLIMLIKFPRHSVKLLNLNRNISWSKSWQQQWVRLVNFIVPWLNKALN